MDNSPTTPAITSLVSCQEVVKTFGEGETRTVALRGVDLEVPAGQMTLLVGPSGCGKTTLISVVAGLLLPSSGRVTVLNQPLHQLNGTQLVQFRQRNIGFVFQQYNLLPTLTAVENAAIPLIIGGKKRPAAIAEAAEVLKVLGLESRLHNLPNQLSGGQQQRVAIARALVHRPRLLVCDEPTAALDANSGRTVMKLLREVAIETSRAVIIVTHDSRVYDFGDSIIHMDDGKVTHVDAVSVQGDLHAHELSRSSSSQRA